MRILGIIASGVAALFRTLFFGTSTGTLRKTTDNGTTFTTSLASDKDRFWAKAKTDSGAATFLGIAYGNGLLVAVGDNVGTIRTSTDGISWITRTSNTAQSLQGVDYGIGTFIAAGDSGEMRRSTDGITWTTQTSTFGSSQILDVAFGGSHVNGIWLAGGASGQLRQSTDGITWTTQASQFGTTMIRAARYGNGTWVVVGHSGQIRTSVAPYVLRKTGTTPFRGYYTYFNNTLIAYDVFVNPGTIFTSTDSITWTTRTSNFTSYIANISYGNGVWVAVGGSGNIRSSTDGVTWTTRTSTFGTTDVRSIVYGNGTWVAVGFSGTISTTTDLTTWTTRTSGVTDDLLGIGYGNGIFFTANGYGNGRKLRSTDAITWVSISGGSSNGQVYAKYLNGKYYVGGDYTYYVSTDATTWTGYGNPNSLISRSLDFANEKFFMVGGSAYGPDFTQTAFISTDAITWNVIALPDTQQTWGLMYYNNEWVVNNLNYDVFRYTESFSWTTQTSNFSTNNIYALSYGNGVWAAGGQGLRTSTDAITWTTRTYINTFDIYSLEYANGTWYLGTQYPNYRVGYSTDAITWSSGQPQGIIFYDFTAAGNKVYAAGFGVRETSDFPINDISYTSVSSFKSMAMWSTTFIGDVSYGGAWKRNATYGNGAFLITNDALSSSTDGITWARSLSSSPNPNVIAYGNGTWVVGFSSSTVSAIRTSTDLITWTTRVTNLFATPNIINSISYGNGFLATGQKGSLSYSTDGITWVTRSSIYTVARPAYAPFSDKTSSLHYFNNKYTLIDYYGIRTSTDTVLWDIDSTMTQNREVVYGNAIWVMTKQNPGIYRSTDLITWTTSSSSIQAYYGTYGNGIFFIQNSDGKSWSSTDAVTWTTRTIGLSTPQTVSYGNGVYASFGYSTSSAAAAYYKSTDAITWTFGGTFASDNGIFDSAYGNGTWVICGGATANSTYTSTDLVSWVTVSQGNTITFVEYANGLFFTALAGNPVVLKSSTDGITWTTRTTNITGAYTAPVAIGYLNTKYYFTANYVSGGSFIAESTDAITWTTKTFDENRATDLLTSAYGAGTWVIGGERVILPNGSGYAQARTSTDTITWTSIAMGPFGPAYSLKYKNGQFFAGLGYYFDSNNLWRSTNGTTWTSLAIGYNYNDIFDIEYAEGRYMLFGSMLVDTTVMLSTDLISWTNVLVDRNTLDVDKRLVSGVYGQNKIIALGGDGQIVRSLSNIDNLYLSAHDGGTLKASTDSVSWHRIVSHGLDNNPIYEAEYGGQAESLTGLTWTSKLAVQSSHSGHASAFGNGLFAKVTGGYSFSAVEFSKDGIGYNVQKLYVGNLSGSQNLSRIAYLNNRWIVTGNALSSGVPIGFAYSTDGLLWTSSSIGINGGYALGRPNIVYGNSVYALIHQGANDYTVLKSTDLATWTSTATGAVSTAGAIAYGAGRFVIGRYDGTVAYSTDLVTWTSVSPTANSSARVDFINYLNNSYFIAGITNQGADNWIWKSTDGITWTTVAKPNTSTGGPSIYVNGLYAMAAMTFSNVYLYTSTDTVTWTTNSTIGSNQTPNSLVTNGEILVMHDTGTKVFTAPIISKNNQAALISSTGNLSKVSTDLAMWTTLSIDHKADTTFSQSLTSNPIRSIAENSRIKAMIGDNGLMMKTNTFNKNIESFNTVYNYLGENAEVYEPTNANPSYKYSDVEYGNGTWLALSAQDTSIPISRSTDLISWTKVDWPYDTIQHGSPSSASYGNGGWVIGFFNGLARSTDLISWTTSYSSGSKTVLLYANGLFVSGDNSGGILTSTDGVSWTARTSNMGVAIWSIQYGNGIWVIGGNSGRIRRSTDAITWTTATSTMSTGATVYSFSYGNSGWIAAGYFSSNYTNSGKLSKSTDAITWTSINTDATTGYLLTIYDNIYTVLGDSGEVLYSTDLNTWNFSTTAAENTYFGWKPDSSKAVYGNGIWAVTDNLAPKIRTLKKKIINSPIAAERLSPSSEIINIIDSKNVYWTSNMSGFNKQIANWTMNTSSAISSGEQHRSIAYGNGLWLAGGRYNNLKTSTNLITWITRAANTNGSAVITAISYGAGVYVLASNAGEIRTSTDGITWTTRTSPFKSTNIITKIIYANNKFLAANTSKVLASSTDGITWTTQSTGIKNVIDRPWYDYGLHYGNGVYLAKVGSAFGKSTVNVYTPYGDTLLYSTDSITWTTQNLGFEERYNLNIRYANGYFSATSFSQGSTDPDFLTYMAYSTDGITWNTSTTYPAGGAPVIYGNGIWVGGQNNGAIYRSTDTITWTNPTSNTSASLNQYFYGNGRWIVAGQSNTIRQSTDAITWTTVTSPFSAGSLLYHPTYENGYYFIIDINGILGYTTDLVTWTTVNTGIGSAPNKILFNGSLYLIPFTQGVGTSTNLVTWTSNYYQPGDTSRANSASWALTTSPLVYGNGGFTLFTYPNNSTYAGYGTYNKIYKSTNGTTWTSSASPTYEKEASFYDITYKNNQFIAVGSAGAIATSTDGTTWTKRTSPNVNLVYDSIEYGNGKYLTFTKSGFSSTSTDSITWTTAEITLLPLVYNFARNNSLRYAAGSFYLAAPFRVYKSTDAISWSADFSETNPISGYNTYFYAMEYANGTMIAVGEPSNILRADAYQLSSLELKSIGQGIVGATSGYVFIYDSSYNFGTGGWKPINTGTNQTFNIVKSVTVSGVTTYLAVGSSYTISSTDLITWTTVTNTPTASTILDAEVV